ncbi:Protein bric-a-brac 2 [Chionoecetes opilio]|uniref:Protein bric-a-brac 2 n=1 Tax=Chionoecetes opilio TaxID=41210 RepID=A0A8J5D0C2_CHIOP|nr:Protein bric-a-brac 2 [Chionoecetes opilio]
MSEYCLRWNNHRPNLVTVFSELLTSEALVDVTLATDGHYIHAHKLVLSACSVYFKDLFGANPCKHPIVILKDIRIDDLKTVIDFIYRGEVNVAQDRLQDVLRTAESLRIKGLAENPRSYDEMSSHSARFLGSQTSRQRSSMTDSREQSLSVEGEEEGEAATPPSNKKRKITSSHDSSESVQEEGEGEERGGGREVKDEPPDDQEADRTTRDAADHDNTTTEGTGEAEDGVLPGGVDASPRQQGGQVTGGHVQGEESRAPGGPVRQGRQDWQQRWTTTTVRLCLLTRPSKPSPHPVVGDPVVGGSQDLGGGGDDAPATNPPPGTSDATLSPHTQGVMPVSGSLTGTADWTLQQLGPWWASVLPALTRHHHHHHQRPPPFRPPPLHPSMAHLPSVRSSLSAGGSGNQPPPGNNGTPGKGAEGVGRGGPLVRRPLDHLSLVAALGKEVSPQMVQALQAVAARRESFSSAAKLYSVSVTTLWRYSKKLGLSEPQHKTQSQ